MSTSASLPLALDLLSHLCSKWIPITPAPLHWWLLHWILQMQTADAPPARGAAAPAALWAVSSDPRAVSAKEH